MTTALHKPRAGEVIWIEFQGREIGLELTELDPVRAKDFLENYNNRNRRMSSGTALRYRRDIQDGLWPFTGETIIIGEDGNMWNGQHRCQGVVDSGVPIPVLIVYNVSEDAMAALDQNRPRTARDILQTSGSTAGAEIPYDQASLSAARLLMQGDKELSKHTGNRQRIAEFARSMLSVLTDTSAWANGVYRASPLIEIHATNREQKSRCLQPSPLTVLTLVMEQHGGDVNSIRLFFEKVSGKTRADNDDEHRSVAAISQWLSRTHPLMHGTGFKFPEMMICFETLINNYNRMRAGQPIRKIVPPHGDPKRWYDELPRVAR